MEQHPTFEGGQDIRDRSFDYACDVVDFCQKLSEGGGVGRLMVPQLLSCSLSFATMLEEARCGRERTLTSSRSAASGSRRRASRGRACASVSGVESDRKATSRVALVERGERTNRDRDDDHQEQAEECGSEASGRQEGVSSASREAASARSRIPNSKFLILNSVERSRRSAPRHGPSDRRASPAAPARRTRGWRSPRGRRAASRARRSRRRRG